VGQASAQPEDGHEPAIVLIRPENRWPADPSTIRFKPSHLRGLAPAGRVDIDSTGLLVFTQRLPSAHSPLVPGSTPGGTKKIKELAD
jgi:16S rRNA U516 pseudouridylate synthase RsuA-like enzyme